MEECPSPQCKIDLIRCLSKKVSKGYLGASLGVVVAACSVVAYLSYDAYSDGRNARVTVIERNRDKIAQHDTIQKLTNQTLQIIREDLKEMKSDQKEVNRKVLNALEVLKSK